MSEWTALRNPRNGGYADGFDRNRHYEWKRVGSDDVWTMRLADMHSAFNVWGLSFRARATGTIGDSDGDDGA
jgi:hypothetical protein